MKEEILNCIEVLNAGGLILYPTDTVWGIGCDATNKDAIDKVYKIKERQNSKSLIVLVANDSMLNKYVKDIPDLAWDIIDISEKPTTIIYDSPKNLASNVIGNDNSIAIRMIKVGFAHQLIFNYRKPIVSTSANITNNPTPLLFDEILDDIKNNVDYIVPSKFNTGDKKPSSLIKLGINGAVEVLRK